MKRVYETPKTESLSINMQRIMEQVVISTSYTSAEGESGAKNTNVWDEEVCNCEDAGNPWGLWEDTAHD